jgi:hypothetical protein
VLEKTRKIYVIYEAWDWKFIDIAMVICVMIGSDFLFIPTLEYIWWIIFDMHVRLYFSCLP